MCPGVLGRARACTGRARGVHGCTGMHRVCLSSEQFPAPPDPIPRKGILLYCSNGK